MPTDTRPLDLDAVRPVLRPDGTVVAKPVTPDFYAELDSEFDGFAGHVLISRHRFTAPWPSWEMHPRGDEIVYLISGDVDFVLRRDQQEETIRVDTPGAFIVVPKGTWHTARPREATVVLLITPGEGTQHAAVPDGPDAV